MAKAVNRAPAANSVDPHSRPDLNEPDQLRKIPPMKPFRIVLPLFAVLLVAGCGEKAGTKPTADSPVATSKPADKPAPKSAMPGTPIPEGGEELVGSDLGIHTLNRGPDEVFAAFEMVDAKETGFETGIRARTIGPAPELPWYTQISTPIAQAFEVGDTVLVSLWARAIEWDETSEEGQVTIYFGQPGGSGEDGEQVAASLSERMKFGAEWQQFLYPLRMAADYPVPGTVLNLDFGHAVQTLEFAGIQVRHYPGKSVEEISVK
jgi:hypothetical protein